MKVTYVATTCMEAVATMHLPSNVKAVLASAFALDALRRVILSEDIPSLTALKGIGEKTAAKVIAEGKVYFAQRPDEAHVRMSYYSSPMYFTEQMLDYVEQAAMEVLATSEYPKEVISLLNELVLHERELINIPLRVTGAPVYNSTPRSMLSDMLGIQPEEVCNKVAIYRHNIGSVGFAPIVYADKEVITNNQRSEIKEKLTEFRRLFLARAVGAGLVTDDGTNYTFFTASPGQLKKGSGYWLRSDCFTEHQKQFWGGLTPKVINVNTDNKGVVMTKVLQYRALLTSAAVPSSEVFGKRIELDKMLCIKELKKNMTADVLSINENYEPTQGVRSDIENSTHDGEFILNGKEFGLIVAQVRMFGQKGLGIGVDVERFCKGNGLDVNPDCYHVTDVDGVVHDLAKEEWHAILNTSVFKMAKLYSSWKDYVEAMKALGFNEFYVCAINEKEPANKTLSRQMLQTLFAATNEDFEYMSSLSYDELIRYCDLDGATSVMSEARKPYARRSNAAKLLTAYPDAMQLDYYLDELNDRYISGRNAAMSGRIRVNGRYMFAVADIVPMLNVLFGKKDIADPDIGIVPAGNCMCDSFPNAKELIALRSPHAFMEWTTLNNMRTPDWLPANVMYFSVYDLTYRILQMDFDGDHVLVIDDEKLVKVVQRIKDEYNIPVLYYEPSAAPTPGPMPAGKAAFCDKIVECILTCLDTNKVGEYSNLATAAWSKLDPSMPKPEREALLRDIAIIAAGINHAVDAQKTYSLNKLNFEFVQQYKFKPYNQRFMDANPSKPSWSEAWDNDTAPIGNGSVDRLAMAFATVLPEYASIDVSSLHFDWRMLLDRDERFNKQVHRCAVPQHIAQMVADFGKVDNDFDQSLLAKMLSGEPIGLPEFFRLLWHQNSSFVKEYVKLEDDFGAINAVKDDRFAMIRGFIVRFMQQDTALTQGMDEQEMLRFAAASLLKNTFRCDKNLRYAGFIVQTFGDIYAEVAARNTAENYTPQEDTELDDFIDAPYSDNYFDPAMDEVVEDDSMWFSATDDIA